MFRKKSTRRPHKCSHTDAQKSFTGSYTHIELERGTCTRIESSGFPEGVSSVVQKQRYADEYRRIYEVDIELENVKKNPGLRFIAKLMLNSLWGKFSMRNELGANKVITRPQEFFSLLFDHKIELSAIVPFSDQALRVLYKPKKNFVSEHTTSNIVISLWTTSCARLKLHDYMVQVDQREDSDLLYTDTDSVVVLHKRETTPLETGEFLGQMSEEYLDYDIKTFICGGAKQYAFRMRHKRTNELEFVQKIRGITFDVNNSKALQFDNFVEKVLNYGRVDNKDDNDNDDHDSSVSPAVFSYQKIMPTRDSKIITRKQLKKYLPVCQKGIINNSYEVFPFGYRPSFRSNTGGPNLNKWSKSTPKWKRKMSSEDSDDAIDFFQDTIEDIVEKINRSEEKIKKWEKKRSSSSSSSSSKMDNMSTMIECSGVNNDEIDDMDDQQEDEDAPTSTVYLNLGKDERTAKKS
ncbi:hypothetical protein niasHT_011958 [Heterodera trifolii]|uniref:DNA-directed DNA polymerase n=1 Tax=Heterodera trifolii TaxID=157864 RepID=A0ABD2LKB0_9BILA